jgi:hypothetical protein
MQCRQASRISATTVCSATKPRGFPRPQDATLARPADFRDGSLQCNQSSRISATSVCTAIKPRGFPRRQSALQSSLADFRDAGLHCNQASRISATGFCTAISARGFPRRQFALQPSLADFRDGILRRHRLPRARGRRFSLSGLGTGPRPSPGRRLGGGAFHPSFAAWSELGAEGRPAGDRDASSRPARRSGPGPSWLRSCRLRPARFDAWRPQPAPPPPLDSNFPLALASR